MRLCKPMNAARRFCSALVLSSALLAPGLWSIPAAQAQACTREYAPVCGQIAGQMPQTFANRCTLDNAKARPIAQGECPHTATPPTQPMLGSDSDAKGCKASAGYSWHAELASCIRPWMTSAITLEVAAHRQKCPGQTGAFISAGEPGDYFLAARATLAPAWDIWSTALVTLASSTSAACLAFLVNCS